MTLTVGSLFSGIGGLDLGLERAGMRVLWQVEIDPYAQAVLAKHWPTVPRYADIHECGRDTLAAVDVLCGGFPCQDISQANTTGATGLAGKRSGLWSEYYRLICELRPRYVLVENVPALLGRGMGTVLGDLAAGGYDAEWQSLPAAAFGAPHIRNRLFLLAYPHRDGWTPQVVRTDRPESQDSPHVIGGWTKAERGSRGQDFTLASRHCIRRMWTPQPGVQRVLDGVPNRVDRLRAIGNAVVPQVAEFVGRCIVAHAALTT